MYKSFYKLRKSPFSLSPDPDFLYLSAKHKNALVVLKRSLVNWVGVSAITGEKGTGKSILIQYLLKQQWPDVTFGLISQSDTPPGGLLKRTLAAFGLNSFGKTTSESYDLLTDFMVIDCFWKKRQPVLIIDEALGTESRTLDELFMLSTMEPEENRNLRIILAMPPSLWKTLKRPKWTHLARRVGNSYHLETLNYQETVFYVQHRLRVAGARNVNLFDDPAYKAIFRYSGGNPRLINVLCNAALVQGAHQEKPQIGAALIKELIMQKLWLRAAIAAPRDEAQRRSEIKAKKVDLAADVPSDTDNLRPAFGRFAKRDKTGQTVSEFIIADIDHASRKYPRLDAEVPKASDQQDHTGEVIQGTVKRFRRVASIAVIILATAAVAIFVDRYRFWRESPTVQHDIDNQGLITAYRPSEEARQKIDLSDPMQAVNESASVIRKLLAPQESRDDSELLTGEKEVPEDVTDDQASSIPIAPASKQSEPVGEQDEGVVDHESQENIPQRFAEAEIGTTAAVPEAPSIPIAPEIKQSGSGGGQDEGAVDHESQENIPQRFAETEIGVTAAVPETPSIPIEPAPKQSETASGQDEGPALQESQENTTELVAEAKTGATAAVPEAPSIPIEPAPEPSEIVSEPDKSSVSQVSKDKAIGLVAEDEMGAIVTEAKEASVPLESDPNQAVPSGTESVEKQVSELLARAEQQIALQHLITPAGDAALETYMSILELMPGHSGALRGIDRIKALYLTWAEAARQREDWTRAQSYAERAAVVDPRDSDVAQLLGQIKSERKLKAEAAALEKLKEARAKAEVKLQEEMKALQASAAEELTKTAPQPIAPAQELETGPSDLQAQRVHEVDSLLIKAQQQFDLQHLTQPAGDNAWETHQKVLQLDPSNQRAREGLQRIIRRIESNARGKQQRGDLPASLAIIEDGLRVLPNHEGLLALKEEINRQIEAQRAAKQVEEQPVPTEDKEAKPEPKTKKRRRVKSFGTFF